MFSVLLDMERLQREIELTLFVFIHGILAEKYF